MRIQYGDRCMSCTQVYEGNGKFKKGVTTVEVSPLPGPAFTEDNITAMDMIRENRRVTGKEVASLMDIGVGSAHHIVRDELQFRSVCKFANEAIETWNERRVEACQEILSRYDGDGEAFLQRIVTGDDSWVQFYEPELKHGTVLHLDPKPAEGSGATICRQSHVDFLLGLQQADLRALHAQRKHCDQCHLLNPSEGESEASYSSETARVVDDGSVPPPRKCEASYCYSNSVDYWGAAIWVHPTLSVLTQPRAVECIPHCLYSPNLAPLSASHTLRTHPTSRRCIFTSSVHWRNRRVERTTGTTTTRLGQQHMSGCTPVRKSSFPRNPCVCQAQA